MVEAIYRLPRVGEEPSRQSRHRQLAAFTLVELMVVVAIVALLVSILLPAAVRARDEAKLIQCASNLHQLVTAVNAYVANSHGQYPPYLTTGTAQSWYDDDKVGAYLPVSRKPGVASTPKGGVYACPVDGPGTILLSYSINLWSSSKIDNTYYLSEITMRSAHLWSARTRYAWKMILLAEGYSGTGSPAFGYSAPVTVGGAYNSTGAPSFTPVATTAGQRFGGQGGISSYTAGRFQKPTSELCYMRHRVLGMPGTFNQPKGRLNLAYADGHVASKTDGDLVDPSGVSTGDSYWSPADFPPGN